MSSLFEELRNVGANLKPTSDGILLTVRGSSDGLDDIWIYEYLGAEDIELVIWILKIFQMLDGMSWNSPCLSEREQALIKPYIPQLNDTSNGNIYALYITEFSVYAFEKGKCFEINVENCAMPNSDDLYWKYGIDYDCD